MSAVQLPLRLAVLSSFHFEFCGYLIMNAELKNLLGVIVFGMGWLGVSGIAAAHPNPYDRYDSWEPQRAGRWEAAIEGRYQDYETIRFNSDITLDPSGSWGAGFSLGYNLDPYLNFSFEVFGDNADYSGTVTTGSSRMGVIDGSLDSSSGQFNITYHFFNSAITPFVAAGLGWTYIDSNIIKNYAGVECWYHPWYGYACGDTYNTYDTTVFSYNAAIGVRVDLSSNLFLRGSVGRQWVDMDETSTHPAIDFGRIELGFMF